MPATPQLKGPSRRPANGKPPQRLVILLHGLGSDGNDLIGLAPHWAQILPDAEFVAPHAPFPCDMAPMGYQWFPLRTFSEQEKLQGAQGVAPILDAFIDAELARTGLTPAQTALVGFSQGTMMSLYVAPRRPAPLAGVLGYSGALIGGAALPGEARSKPPIYLIHGDADDLVPVGALFQATGELAAAEIPAQWHICHRLGHSIDQAGLDLGGQFLRSCLAKAPVAV